MNFVIGNYHTLARWASERCPASLSFLHRDWPDVDTWRSGARAKVHELLAFEPPRCELNARVEQTLDHDGLHIEVVSYDQPFGPRTEALLLRPAGAPGRLPGVIALHDHGSFKYLGKEKIADAGCASGDSEGAGDRRTAAASTPVADTHSVSTATRDLQAASASAPAFNTPSGRGASASGASAGGSAPTGPAAAALPEIATRLEEFRTGYYGGRFWANELAKRGYVVFVPDVFLFGSRKVSVESLPETLRAPIEKHEPGTRPHVEAYNQFAAAHEHIMAKVLFLSGTTWPGIVAYEDSRAVDYLITRPEVDPERLGCGGLSGGGLRTVFLAGLDPRITCGVCVGFMSTHGELVAEKIGSHTWMYQVPHMPEFLDMPDLISLRAPAPLMVQYDEEDILFTEAGQHGADEKIKAVYTKIGAPERYSGRFYPGPHKFDVPMQEDAFDWFDRWLKAAEA